MVWDHSEDCCNRDEKNYNEDEGNVEIPIKGCCGGDPKKTCAPILDYEQCGAADDSKVRCSDSQVCLVGKDEGSGCCSECNLDPSVLQQNFGIKSVIQVKDSREPRTKLDLLASGEYFWHHHDVDTDWPADSFYTTLLEAAAQEEFVSKGAKAIQQGYGMGNYGETELDLGEFRQMCCASQG